MTPHPSPPCFRFVVHNGRPEHGPNLGINRLKHLAHYPPLNDLCGPNKWVGQVHHDPLPRGRVKYRLPVEVGLWVVVLLPNIPPLDFQARTYSDPDHGLVPIPITAPTPVHEGSTKWIGEVVRSPCPIIITAHEPILLIGEDSNTRSRSVDRELEKVGPETMSLRVGICKHPGVEHSIRTRLDPCHETAWTESRHFNLCEIVSWISI